MANKSSQSASAAVAAPGHGTTPRTGRGVTLEAYQAIRSAVAEEIALRTNNCNTQFTAGESGATTVVRERAARGAPASQPQGTIVVS